MDDLAFSFWSNFSIRHFLSVSDPQLGSSKCNGNVWKVFTFWKRLWTRGWGPFRRFLGANIAISCLRWRHASWWYVHAAQNEPIMNIFKPHCQAVRLWNHLGACGGLTKPTQEPIRLCQHRIPRSRILTKHHGWSTKSNAAHSCSKYVQLGA